MTTPILDLDEWEQSQAQPHVTVNESIRWLECFAQLSVLDRDLDEPPTGTPSDGDRYIVADPGAGDWENQGNKIAMYMGTAWAFKDAPPGAICYVEDEDDYVRWQPNSPAGWIDFP